MRGDINSVLLIVIGLLALWILATNRGDCMAAFWQCLKNPGGVR